MMKTGENSVFILDFHEQDRLVMKAYFPWEDFFSDSELVATHHQDILSQNLHTGFRFSVFGNQTWDWILPIPPIVEPKTDNRKPKFWTTGCLRIFSGLEMDFLVCTNMFGKLLAGVYKIAILNFGLRWIRGDLTPEVLFLEDRWFHSKTVDAWYWKVFRQTFRCHRLENIPDYILRILLGRWWSTNAHFWSNLWIFSLFCQFRGFLIRLNLSWSFFS